MKKVFLILALLSTVASVRAMEDGLEEPGTTNESYTETRSGYVFGKNSKIVSKQGLKTDVYPGDDLTVRDTDSNSHGYRILAEFVKPKSVAPTSKVSEPEPGKAILKKCIETSPDAFLPVSPNPAPKPTPKPKPKKDDWSSFMGGRGKYRMRGPEGRRRDIKIERGNKAASGSQKEIDAMYDKKALEFESKFQRGN